MTDAEVAQAPQIAPQIPDPRFAPYPEIRQQILVKIINSLRQIYQSGPKSKSELRECATLVCPKHDFRRKKIQYIAPRLAEVILRVHTEVSKENYERNMNNDQYWLDDTRKFIDMFFEELQEKGAAGFARAYREIPIRVEEANQKIIIEQIVGSLWSVRYRRGKERQELHQDILDCVKLMFPSENFQRVPKKGSRLICKFMIKKLAAALLEEFPHRFEFEAGDLMAPQWGVVDPTPINRAYRIRERHDTVVSLIRNIIRLHRE
jgi:hypothetical protein